MLPSELLRVRFRRGEIRPAYLDHGDEYIKLAGNIIAIFSESIGKKKLHLNKRLQELEEELFDYKLVRGLSILLERRSVFKINANLQPEIARAAVFQEASKLGFNRREEAIAIAAKTLNAEPEEVERSLFADIDDELVLDSFQPIKPEELISNYNLSLTQTLLFKCIRLEFSISQNWKKVFASIKRNGLMYSIQKVDSSFVISVDGPLSIFRMTEKYGTSIAKLLPDILSSGYWHINSDILWRNKNRILKFSISSVDSISFPELEYSEGYDSTVEERFADEFSSFNTGWVMRREPEPLIVAPNVFIPDFSFEKGGRKIYFEIVGFWTKEYIDNKIRKLRALADSSIILAVDENLACSKLEQLPYDIIYYKGKVPVKELISRLKKIQDEMEDKEVRLLEQAKLDVEGEIISFNDIANKLSVSLESLRRYMQKAQLQGYVKVGDSLLSQSKLKKIAGELKGVQKLSDALSIIESNGVMYPYDLLQLLGYRVRWVGLSAEESMIEQEA
ncbi:MAG: DUF790 family protein [Conexivisphaerales archaeon]